MRSLLDAMLNDPRSNTHQTFAERLADKLGTAHPERVKERMANGMRVRQGSSCVVVRESRASAQDPFNQSVRQMPRLVEACD